MIAAQNIKSIGVLDFECQQQTDSFNALFASVYVIA
jgi:hypothetical protein